jgi:predicted O-methyltransferase YrrM
MRELLAQIEACAVAGSDHWCSEEKRATLAALVIALRPRVVVEIGVWEGGSLLPMLLAMRHVKRGHAIAIDPWSADASVADQVPANAEWWGQIDHEKAYQKFLARLDVYDVRDACTVHRMRSDDAPIPPTIDLLHVDGNHAEQVLRDVNRFVPSVPVGGIVIMDDVAWEGGHVMRATQRARELGCIDLYPLGTGIVMQRTLAT